MAIREPKANVVYALPRPQWRGLRGFNVRVSGVNFSVLRFKTLEPVVEIEDVARTLGFNASRELKRLKNTPLYAYVIEHESGPLFNFGKLEIWLHTIPLYKIRSDLRAALQPHRQAFKVMMREILNLPDPPTETERPQCSSS